MTLQQDAVELLDFYCLDDLVEFNEYVEQRGHNPEEAWHFLNENTIKDYLATEREPNIERYIALYEHIKDDRYI